MKAWRLILEPWRANRPVVADSYHNEFEEELDPDPDLHESEKLDPVRIRISSKAKSWIRIRIPH
jgi:hypothetical protein